MSSIESGQREALYDRGIPNLEKDNSREVAELLRGKYLGEADVRSALLKSVEWENGQAIWLIDQAVSDKSKLFSPGLIDFIDSNRTFPANLGYAFLNRDLIIKPKLLDDGEKRAIREQSLTLLDETLSALTPSEDKIDAIEAIMAVEDAFFELIEIGDYATARKLFAKYPSDPDEEALSDLRSSYVELQVRVGLAQLASIGDFRVEDVSPGQIQEFLKGNDYELLKGLGHFGLVKPDQLARLRPDARIAVENGMHAVTKGKNDPSETVAEVIEGREMQVLKAVLLTTESSSELELLYQQLVNEAQGEMDLSKVGRLVKGLIDRGDMRAADIAVDLFQREDLPEHFRIYLARKLCDSGRWARQIIDHFREYRLASDESGVRLETLSAIINQMHETPSLEVYKALEQTRLNGGQEVLKGVAEFGRKIFTLTNIDVEAKIEIFSFWAGMVNTGQIDSRDLDKLDVRISQVASSVEEYWRKSMTDRRHVSINREIKRMLCDVRIFNSTRHYSWLLENGILPTQHLIDFAEQNNDLKDELERLQSETRAGQFDPSNLVQRDLEYAWYLSLCRDGDYSKFQNLSAKDRNEEVRKLTLQEIVEAEAATYEAAQVYWLIRDRIDRGRKVSVIGNRRYGDYFVIDVLRRDLEDIGAQVSSFKIGSTRVRRDMIQDVFPQSYIEGLAAEQPDVVIVDGTPNSMVGGKGRLPSAMVGYEEWFKHYNKVVNEGAEGIDDTDAGYGVIQKIAACMPAVPYEVAYWSPAKVENIVIGNETTSRPNMIPDTDTPVVILANPVMPKSFIDQLPEHLQDHNPGFFDDPEKYARGEKIVKFTQTGVRECATIGLEENVYVDLIQARMLAMLPEIRRITDPQFRSTKNSDENRQ